jgi:nucleotide-binding universal stress UspA family protein
MLDAHSQAIPKRRSQRAPFPRILCAVDGTEASSVAIDQAIAIADGDSRIEFAASWYGKGSLERAAATDEAARDAAEQAVERARAAGVQASARYFHVPKLVDGILAATALHDLVVAGAGPHARMTGIVLGELATQLVHRCALPVLVAREHPLEAGVVAATRAVPADRFAVTTGAHIAARIGAEFMVVHVPERHDEKRRPELQAELANARALLGRPLDYLEDAGPPARALVAAAEGDGAGLVVVGSEGKQGLGALRSVSERVAHLAPCSVLVMRGR